ncbi:MAG: thrB 1 [Paenibacillaceae bacterium]|jgi:homoserine kinase type II|nr:thrB 1 [Paenibacillaceae bacterium]
MEDRIIADLKESYGITFSHSTPVTGGLLNLKWRISTDSGRDLLVKQYSAKRFNRERIESIESALQRQIILEECGVACPVLRQCGDRVIRWLDDQTAYMVMEFCPGRTETSDTVTIAQMRSLGSACAVMHRAFSRFPAPPVKSMPVSGGYTVDSLWENFNFRMTKDLPDADAAYRTALLALEPILRQLGDGFYDKFPTGFAHEDFHSGNILFDAGGVSAIVDFDRNCYSYMGHDIGRTVLSFALEEHTLNINKAGAFLEGYSRHLPLTKSDIADALRLTWCIETPWWIRPEFFGTCDEIPKRFKDEMLWLSEHWFELDALLRW